MSSALFFLETSNVCESVLLRQTYATRFHGFAIKDIVSVTCFVYLPSQTLPQWIVSRICHQRHCPRIVSCICHRRHCLSELIQGFAIKDIVPLNCFTYLPSHWIVSRICHQTHCPRLVSCVCKQKHCLSELFHAFAITDMVPVNCFTYSHSKALSRNCFMFYHQKPRHNEGLRIINHKRSCSWISGS